MVFLTVALSPRPVPEEGRRRDKEEAPKERKNKEEVEESLPRCARPLARCVCVCLNPLNPAGTRTVGLHGARLSVRPLQMHDAVRAGRGDRQRALLRGLGRHHEALCAVFLRRLREHAPPAFERQRRAATRAAAAHTGEQTCFGHVWAFL